MLLVLENTVNKYVQLLNSSVSTYMVEDHTP